MAKKWDIFAMTERVMRMDDVAWARHANPLSVYSRMTILPLMSIAVWSRVWLGWGSLTPIAFVLVWVWLNPRLFPAPKSTRNWASEGTFGERVLLNRAKVPIPGHHLRWAVALSAVAGIGAMPWMWGLWRLDLGMTLFGLSLMMGGKLWAVDRMVWLYQDMKDTDPLYASWSR